LFIRRVATWIACVATGCFGAAVLMSGTGPLPSAAADPVNVVIGPQGFDACVRPPLSSMSTWRQNSPYRVYGLYIGGVNQRCSGGGTNAYIAALHQQGWDIIPIYVGQQAPCVGQPGLATFPTDPTAAWNAGVQDANDAIAQFAKTWQLGAPPGVIYADQEPFSDGAFPNGPCSVAAINYLGAWTTVMQGHGLKAGVYSAAGSTIRLMYSYVARGTSFRAPDNIWIASWGPCGPGPDYCTYLPNASVFDGSFVRPYVPDSYWFYDQRLYQYNGTHTETWGGVAISIDSDCVDGQVLGPYAPKVKQACANPYR